MNDGRALREPVPPRNTTLTGRRIQVYGSVKCSGFSACVRLPGRLSCCASSVQWVAVLRAPKYKVVFVTRETVQDHLAMHSQKVCDFTFPAMIKLHQEKHQIKLGVQKLCHWTRISEAGCLLGAVPDASQVGRFLNLPSRCVVESGQRTWAYCWELAVLHRHHILLPPCGWRQRQHVGKRWQCAESFHLGRAAPQGAEEKNASMSRHVRS